MQVHEVADDGESQAESGVSARCAGAGLAEWFEHVGQKPRGDTLAGVADPNLELAVGPCRPQRNGAAWPCVLHGVGQQVPDDLLQSRRVPDHRAGIRREPAFNHHALRLRTRTQTFDRALEHVDDWDRGDVKRVAT